MEKPPYRAPVHISREDSQLKIRLVTPDGVPREVVWRHALFEDVEKRCEAYKNAREQTSFSKITPVVKMLADNIKDLLFNKEQISKEKNAIWNFLNGKCKDFHIVIEIHTSDYRVANLPWEFAGISAVDVSPGVFEQAFSIVRTPISKMGEDRSLRSPGVYETRLICSADPQDSFIKRNIDEQAAGILKLKLPWLTDHEKIINISIDEMITQVRLKKPYVFHFIGHGTEAGLFMADNKSQKYANLQPAQVFASIFNGQAPRLAVLMACESAKRTANGPSVAEQLVLSGAHFAIGNLFPIGAPAAQCFAQHFYTRIQENNEEFIPLYIALESARSGACAEARYLKTFHYASAYTPVVYTDGTEESLYLPLRPSANSLNEIILNLCAKMTRKEFSEWKSTSNDIIKRNYNSAQDTDEYKYLFENNNNPLFSKISLLTKLLMAAFDKDSLEVSENLRFNLKILINKFTSKPRAN